MHTTFSIICLFLCSIAGLAQDKVSVTIQGTITHPNSDSIEISNYPNKERIALVRLDDNSSFKTTISVPRGFYKIGDFSESTKIYLDKGYDLSLTLDTDSFDESIKYNGVGADINNYIVENYLLSERLRVLEYYAYYLKLEEKAFLHRTDSVAQLYSDLLSAYDVQNEHFLFLEKAALNFNKTRKLGLFESSHGHFANKPDFEVSENYPDFYQGLNLSDRRLLDAEGYLGILQRYFEFQKRKDSISRKEDYCIYILKEAITQIKDKKVLEEFFYYYAKYNLTRSRKLDESYDLYKSIEKDEERLAEITKNYLAKKRTQKGAVSPSFTFEQRDGKEVSLSEFKGKVVYIDIWATWCGPCLRQAPYFDTLYNALKDENIVFLSICKSDKKERWENYLKKHNPPGVHLFAENSKASFFTEYQVTGIPRYILLDEKGFIINPEAGRPSQKTTLTELKKALAH